MKLHEIKPNVYKYNHCDKEFTRKDNQTSHLKNVHRAVSVQLDIAKVMKDEKCR